MMNSTVNEEIRDRLFQKQDLKYREFHSKLVPTLDKERIIGVRQPDIKKLAVEYSKRDGIKTFICSLPHKYYEENNLHGCIISMCRNTYEALSLTDAFLPFVDNWATCDLLSLKVPKNDKEKLRIAAEKWLLSKKTYTVRFGIKVLMDSFLDEDFDLKYPEAISSLKSGDYYIDMMVAWYFATALAKRRDSIIPFITDGKLGKVRNNRTIQKAVESNRIDGETKDFLRKYKIK